jgi:hypothetical protein
MEIPSRLLLHGFDLFWEALPGSEELFVADDV